MAPSPRAAPPFVPDAVVFDLDGVLVDSEGLWAEVEEQVVVALGFDWDPALHAALHGQGAHEAAAALARHLGARVTPEEVQRRTADRIEDLFARGVPVNEGAVEVLEALSGRVPLAVATNSSARLAHHALVGNDLDQWFDAIVTADDVTASKPAPDPYLLACERLGARARRSVAIEDSSPGMAAARAAGLWLIACVPGDGDVDGAHARITSLAELDAAELLGGPASGPASG